jgi:hypothetical protein
MSIRAAAPVIIALMLACSFDWDGFDPRLAPAEGGAGGANAGGSVALGGGGTAASGGSGGVGGAACAVGTQLCADTCVDVDTDPLHCGDCATSCIDQVCIVGTCQPPTSCKELQLAQPALLDGSYTLLPDPNGPSFVAHCDMTTDGGGWTLVASVVDNSYFNGTTCHTACTPDLATTCDESPFTAATVVGDVAAMLQSDHKSAAYGSVAFDEMLFVDSNGQYVSYDVSGASVVAWYPAGLQNYVPSGTEAHDTFSYPAKVSDLDPMLNNCATLRVSFNVEDSDSSLAGSCHSTKKGPVWSRQNNGACFWDDAGIGWTGSAFYTGNTTAYRLWLVR